MRTGKNRARLLTAAAALLLAAGCAAKAPEDGTLSTGGNSGSPLPLVAETPAAVPTASPLDARLLAASVIAPSVSEADALAVLRALADESGGLDYCTWLEEEERRVYIYRSTAYGDYTLVLAMEPFDGEVEPELFCVRNGSVEYRTYGSDCWSINYTRLPGATIVYGDNFAYDADTTRIEAVFLDGQRVEQALVRSANADVSIYEGRASFDEGSGFILVAEGQTGLASLVLYNGDIPVTDDANGTFIQSFGDLSAWTSGGLAIWDRLHFSPCRAGLFCADESEVSLSKAATGLEDTMLMRVTKDCAERTDADFWRNNNARYYSVELPAGASVPVLGLPDEITRVFFAEPARDAAGDAGAITEASLVNEAFSLAGFAPGTRVTLVIESRLMAYVLPIRVK